MTSAIGRVVLLLLCFPFLLVFFMPRCEPEKPVYNFMATYEMEERGKPEKEIAVAVRGEDFAWTSKEKGAESVLVCVDGIIYVRRTSGGRDSHVQYHSETAVAQTIFWLANPRVIHNSEAEISEETMAGQKVVHYKAPGMYSGRMEEWVWEGTDVLLGGLQYNLDLGETRERPAYSFRCVEFSEGVPPDHIFEVTPEMKASPVTDMKISSQSIWNQF